MKDWQNQEESLNDTAFDTEKVARDLFFATPSSQD